MRKFLTATTVVVALAATAAPAEARASKPCLMALDDAEEIRDLFIEYNGYNADFFASVSSAAGTASNAISLINSITAATKVFNDQVLDITRRTKPAVAAYNRHATKCRA